MDTLCPNCHHADAHRSGGIGVCLHTGCGCDNTTPWSEPASKQAASGTFLPHDPLCGWGSDSHPECFPAADCGNCDLITRARADTIDRIAGHVLHGSYCSCGAEINNFRLHLLEIAGGRQ